MNDFSGQTLHILLVVADDEKGERIRALLGRARFFRAACERVSSPLAALHRIGEEPFDALLLDVPSGDLQGLSLLDEGEIERFGMPVIVLSEREDERLALKAVSGGAQDYLVLRDLDATTLERAVRYAVERHRLVTELRDLALVDSLTGLNNRRAFETVGRQQVKVAERVGSRLYVFFLDLDNLKWINDTGGHAAGDRVLRDLADILRATFRSSDLIARLGGDEFAVLAPQTSAQDDPKGLLERLRQGLEQYNTNDENHFGLSLSAGVALFDPESPTSLESLLEKADRAMYEEKWQKKAARRNRAAGS